MRNENNPPELFPWCCKHFSLIKLATMNFSACQMHFCFRRVLLFVKQSSKRVSFSVSLNSLPTPTRSLSTREREQQFGCFKNVTEIAALLLLCVCNTSVRVTACGKNVEPPLKMFHKMLSTKCKWRSLRPSYLLLSCLNTAGLSLFMDISSLRAANRAFGCPKRVSLVLVPSSNLAGVNKCALSSQARNLSGVKRNCFTGEMRL